LQEKNLLVKFDTERGSSERLFASAELQLKKWVHVVFTLHQTEYTEATLYINGVLDSEIAVRNESLFNEGKCYIGKDPWNHGFIGSIAEPIFFFSALPGDEISRMYQHGMQNWNESNAFKTSQIFYMKKTEGMTQTLIKDAEAPKMLETTRTVKKQDKGVAQLTVFERLDQYFQANPKMYMKVGKLLPYFDWLAAIYRILRVALPTYRDDEGNILDKLELDRMMPPLYQVNLYFTKKELLALAKAAKSYSSVAPERPNDDPIDLIHYFDFLDNLRSYTDSIELGEQLGSADMDPREKFNHVYTICEEFMSNRSGNFEVCIDFCVNCGSHQTTTRHSEREYQSWFNDTYKDISEEFPACEIVGNKYGPPRIGTFAASIEGVGSDQYKDKFGRLKLYKIKNERPVTRFVLDSIYLVAYVYGNTQELTKFQAEYRKEVGEDNRHCVMSLITLSEDPRMGGQKKREETLELLSDQEMYCKHWGCQSKIYTYGKNHKRACRYHPGRWEFGSIHGLWPENWTCCRGEWTTPGCKIGFHEGVPNSFVMHKCINRGENNPVSLHPDSFCGRSFPDPNTCGKKNKPNNSCSYHSGHLEFNERGGCFWTCCNAEADPMGMESGGCVDDEHRFAEYPDEEAKIYFITKSVANPGIQPNRTAKKETFSKTATSSRFFNTEIKPYINPYQKKKNKEALDNEARYCLNSTCEKTYKETDNHDRACQCHTGYWDFGHSGILKGQDTIVLWEPHWRCCGGKWEDPGCKRTRHCGPLVSKMEERRWV